MLFCMCAIHQTCLEGNQFARCCRLKHPTRVWFLQRFLQRSKATAFAGWQSGAAVSYHRRQQTMQATMHFLHQRLGACFLVWRACTQQQLLQQDQLQAALLHWTQGSLGQAFGAWQAWVARRVSIRIRVAGRPLKPNFRVDFRISGIALMYSSHPAGTGWEG